MGYFLTFWVRVVKLWKGKGGGGTLVWRGPDQIGGRRIFYGKQFYKVSKFKLEKKLK